MRRHEVLHTAVLLEHPAVCTAAVLQAELLGVDLLDSLVNGGFQSMGVPRMFYFIGNPFKNGWPPIVNGKWIVADLSCIFILLFNGEYKTRRRLARGRKRWCYSSRKNDDHKITDEIFQCNLKMLETERKKSERETYSEREREEICRHVKMKICRCEMM